MVVNILKNLFSGKKEANPPGSILCQDGCYLIGCKLDDGSVEGLKYFHEELVASGRFITGELSGLGKRYSDGQILCEGYFKEGNLSGEGKMYSHFGHVIYEGNFAKKPNDYGSAYHGMGREYHYKTGVLLYEGEFYYNRWMGNGKEYYPNGQLRYQGEFRDSFWHGHGKYFDKEGNLFYEGEFKGESMPQSR